MKIRSCKIRDKATNRRNLQKLRATVRHIQVAAPPIDTRFPAHEEITVLGNMAVTDYNTNVFINAMKATLPRTKFVCGTLLHHHHNENGT